MKDTTLDCYGESWELSNISPPTPQKFYNWNRIRDELKFTKTNHSFSDISDEVLKEAAEMVVYLNFCPPKEAMFYYNLLMTSSIKDIFIGNL